MNFNEFKRNNMAVDAIIRNFEIIGELEKDFTLVLNDAIDSLKEKYQTKFNLGEPFYISDVYRTLNDVDGVVDTVSVDIEVKNGAGYSPTEFDVEQNTSRDGRLIKVPDNTILEIKDLDADIVGVIR